MAMLGTKENEVEYGYWYSDFPLEVHRAPYRFKLPHGWLVPWTEGVAFVPFAEDGTGWGKNDPASLRSD